MTNNTTLLIILNPRAIPECIDALRELRGVDKAWCSYYTEIDLELVLPSLVANTNYQRYSIISDDTTPTQDALDNVLRIHTEHQHGLACGWVNIDAISNASTYHPTPLNTGAGVTNQAYTFATIDEAHAMPGTQRTYFHGMVFSTMTRDLALRYPFQSYNGCASDLHHCTRLQNDDVPIYTAANTFVHHVKEQRNRLDTAHHKRLLIGERARRVTIETEHNT